MDDQIDWADIPATHVGPLEGEFEPLGGELTELATVAKVEEKTEEVEKSADASADAESEILAGADDSGSESDISLDDSDAGKLIKNFSYFEYISFYKSIHNILSMLIESDDDMREFVKTCRDNDARFHAQQKEQQSLQQQQQPQPQQNQQPQQSLSSSPQVLPSVETFFKQIGPVRTASQIAVASQAESFDSFAVKIGGDTKEAVLNGYDPSLWFYKPGRNPIQFIPGQKERFYQVFKFFLLEYLMKSEKGGSSIF